MPPVSMHSVWLAARMASGQASSSVARTPLALNRPGATSPVTTYRTTRTPPRTMAGRSTSAWRHWVMAGSAVADSHRSRFLRTWSRPPIMTTTMMMTPRATSA